MIRLYGNKPYQTVVVHGGPGAIGACYGIAEGLADYCGVIEPFQSALSINEMIAELRAQIITLTKDPVTLIGHSWGAWLSGLAAAAYPGLVKKLILVGAGPLTVDYVPFIEKRRNDRLSQSEQLEFGQLLKQLESADEASKDQLMERLGSLTEKADYYQKLDQEPGKLVKVDGMMYEKIWREASQMRQDGTLLEQFGTIKIPIILIQGTADPHLAEGVITPLQKLGIDCRYYLLDRCGHSPWKEVYAADRFFSILKQEIKL